MSFEKTDICSIGDSFTRMIRDDWALLTAGVENDFNTMTVSWGAAGELWGKDIVAVFVRPQRYTFEFMEKCGEFSLSFFGGEYKKALSFCGSKSGRDLDKAKECGITPVVIGSTVGFEEARLIIRCKKIAVSDMSPESFLDPSIAENYPKEDYHRVYIGEVTEVLKKI